MSTLKDLYFISRRGQKPAFSVACVAFLLFSAASLFGQPVRIQDDEARKAVVQKVQPTYPPIARQMNLSGRVMVDLTVAADGSVEKTDVVSGNPILAGAAVSAAKRWKFNPFQVDGKVTEAVVRIAFEFSK
ncbi:MAG: energy transducer TonB [Bryobacteraceae bacterium]